MIASSSSSPPMRIERAVTMPPREITATSVGPLPRWAGADGCGHRVLDDVGGPGSGGDGSLFDCPLLDAGDPGGYADHDARLGEHPSLVHLLDEVAEHFLC